MKTAIFIIFLVCSCSVFTSGDNKCFYCNVDDEPHDDESCEGINNFQTISDINRCPDTSLESSVKIKYEHNSEKKVFAEGCFCEAD